jgi:hypothetical protein
VTGVTVKTTRPFLSQFGGAVDATVTYSVTNTGNENLTPHVAISVSPLLGSAKTDHVKLPLVLPGSTVTFKHTFEDVLPFGHLTSTVVASASGATNSGSIGTVVVPWGLVVIVVILLVVLFYRRRRRNRRRGADGESAEPEAPQEAAEGIGPAGSSQ